METFESARIQTAARAVGVAQKKFFEVENEIKLSVEELYNLNNKWYYNY